MIPIMPDTPATHRIRVTGSVSDAVWQVLYTNPDPKAARFLDQLAREAIERDTLHGQDFFAH